VRGFGRPIVTAMAALALVTTSMIAPASAGAITPQQVMARATKWVKKRVPYSQRRHYKGYRQDCSGFVSMAWGLKRSYTTRTIARKARRISISSLKPGDAVLRRGRHVSLFGGWKDKSRRLYWAYEQTTWGSHAKKHVRRIPRRAIALRRKGLERPVLVAITPPSGTTSVTIAAAGAASALP
jgi:hypothetical protein